MTNASTSPGRWCGNTLSAFFDPPKLPVVSPKDQKFPVAAALAWSQGSGFARAAQGSRVVGHGGTPKSSK